MEVGQKVVMKKKHPCDNDIFEITRVGADIKIKCIKCQKVLMIDRCDFDRKLKKIL